MGLGDIPDFTGQCTEHPGPAWVRICFEQGVGPRASMCSSSNDFHYFYDPQVWILQLLDLGMKGGIQHHSLWSN